MSPQTLLALSHLLTLQMISILVPTLQTPAVSPSLWQPKLFLHVSQCPQ